MSILKCENLSVAYENMVVFENVNFEIESGDYVCIVGENGSGKSTLMKSVLGLIPLRMGKVEFLNGLEKKEVGYLPQQTIIQKDFPASVYEVVISGCINKMGLRPFYTSKEKKRAKDVMEKLEITSIKNKSYRDLSGGQQQRVLLARALCATDKLLVLDEPITGLDPIVTAEMYRIIKEINQKENITVIMVSHDIESAVKEADKVLHIENGVKFFGTTKDYINSDIGKIFVSKERNVR